MSAQPLCYRCEHRAAYLETGEQPRSHCGQVDTAVISCYMYRPVKPVVLTPDKGDGRPLGAPAMIAARAEAVGIAPGHWIARCVPGGVAIYYERGHRESSDRS